MKKKNLKSFLYLLFVILIINCNAFSQNSNGRENALKIYYDCNFCDEEFIKKELTYVNYVRDSKEAQVHVMVTAENSGNGGNKYSFFFIGQDEFKSQNDTLFCYTNSDETSDEIREKQLQIMKLGLMRYVAKTPIALNLKITYLVEGKESDVIKDKWNSWVFNMNLNGYFNGEKTYKYSNLNTSFDVSRVTPTLKFEANISASFNKQVYDIDDSLVTSKRKSKYFEHLLVKSINDHWSIGYVTELSSSSYSNYDYNALVAPAIEYNIFPYSESSRKQIRFLYHAGINYSDYVDTTLYNKTKELLYSQKLTIATEFKEKWGSISFSLLGSSYFSNFDYNRLELNSSINLRLIKGLSLRLYGGAALIHDQLNLPKGNASSEDILLSRKQLASQYRYWGSIGLTYTFGSIYNNVVNPRFGN